ncbi:DUF6056 family protein [Coprobacter sp.]
MLQENIMRLNLICYVMRKCKFIVLLSLCLVFIGFFLLNNYTPKTMDDFVYAFKFLGSKTPIHERISTIEDIFISQYHHYFLMNGRSIVHFFVQYFCSFENPLLFNFLNSVFFVCLIALLSLYVCRESKCRSDSQCLFIFFLTIALCWFLIPTPNMTLLWKTGSVNYLWVMVFTLFFLLIFSAKPDKTEVKYKYSRLIILFLFSFFCGWGHEGISVGISAGLFLYCFIRKKRLTTRNFVMSVGYWLGSSLVIFSPGILNRADSVLNVDSLYIGIAKRIMAIYKMFIELQTPATALLVVLLLYLFIRHRLFLKIFIRQNLLLILIVLSYLLFQIVTAFPGEGRGAFGMEIVSILLIIMLCAKIEYRFSVRRKFIGIAVLLVAVLIEYGFALNSCIQNYECVDVVLKEYNKSKNGIVRSPFPPKFKNSRFIYWKYSFDVNFSTMVAFSFYYNPEKQLSVLDKRIYDELYLKDCFCLPKNEISGCPKFYTSEDVSCFVYKITDGMNIEDIKVECRYKSKYENLPLSDNSFVNSLLSKRDDRYSGIVNNGFVLSTNYGKYLLIKKLEPEITHIQIDKLAVID